MSIRIKLTKYLTEIKNNKSLFIVSLYLILPVVLDFLSVIIGGKFATYLCYGSIFLFTISFMGRQMAKKRIIGILCIYLCVVVNVILFPDSESMITSMEFLLTFFFFLPITLLYVLPNNDWNQFFKIFAPLASVAVLMNIFIVFFTDVDLYTDTERLGFNYMELSYAVLPSLCCLYAYCRDSKSILYLILFVVGFFSIIAFGARATLIYTVLFVCLREILGASKITNMILPMIVGLIIVLCLPEIINVIANNSQFKESYALNLFLRNDFFEHSTRTTIYDTCKNLVMKQGVDMYGLFGDRYLLGGTYPHNIFFEIILQFGWFFGVFLIFGFVIKLIMILKRKDYRIIIVFLCCAILGRYFVSGSYLIEGRFWIMIGCILSLASQSYKRKRI